MEATKKFLFAYPCDHTGAPKLTPPFSKKYDEQYFDIVTHPDSTCKRLMQQFCDMTDPANPTRVSDFAFENGSDHFLLGRQVLACQARDSKFKNHKKWSQTDNS